MVSISECQVDKLGEKGESSNEKNVFAYMAKISELGVRSQSQSV